MKTFTLRPLSFAIVAALSLVIATPVFAQAQDVGSGGGTMREQRAKRLKELGRDQESKKAQEEAAPLYPNATRQSPEAKAKGKGLKELQDLQALYEKQDSSGVIAKAEQIASRNDANAYEKSFAYQLAGSTAADLNDQAKAAEYFKKAIDANGLENNSHYQVMYNLAVVQYGEQKYADALATLDRFLAETKEGKPEHQSLRAGILGAMGRNAEAAKLFEELMAKNPNDKRVLMNAVASYQQAEQFDKANALLEGAYKRGQLTEAKELRALYVGYMNAERWKDAQAVIDDGMAKGILSASPELAKDLMVLAQNAYYKGSDKDAIDLYRKAAPMAPDGEAYLNLAKILRDQGKTADAKAAAQQALEKGVKRPEEAKQIISR
jgi:tetratricopeptide (TPR) repeat protein